MTPVTDTIEQIRERAATNARVATERLEDARGEATKRWETTRKETRTRVTRAVDTARDRTRTRVHEARGKALEFGVYLPLGAYARAREGVADLTQVDFDKVVTDLTKRGQGRFDELERKVRLGVRTVRRQTGRAASTTATTARRTARKTAARATAASAPATPKMPRVAQPKSASELAIDGYDSLTADAVVSRLGGLTQTELAKIYKYEAAHENRSTILDAVASRLTVLPVPTYDALTVDEIIERAEKLPAQEIEKLLRYERDTKARSTLLDKLEALTA